MRLENVAPAVRRTLGIAEAENAMFVRFETGMCRDGLRLSSGKKISLQQLGTGVRVTIPTLIEHAAPMTLTPEYA